MRKIVASFLVVLFCFFVASGIVVAATPRWYVGEPFNKKGHKVTKEESRTGNFYNGLRLLEKFSENDTVTIELKAEKKNLLSWKKVGNTKKVNISDYGALNGRIEDNNYSASGTNKVRLIWEQTTDGSVGAELRY